MSLDAHYEECAEEHKPFIEEGSNLYTYAHLFMFTGTHAIKTDEDVKKFQYRLRLYSNATGNDWTERIADAHKFKGMYTNVGTETDGQFTRRMTKLLVERSMRTHLQALKVLDEAKQATSV